MKKKLIILLAFGIIVLALSVTHVANIVSKQKAANEFWGSFENFDVNKQPWIECIIELPDEKDEIVFLRQHSHPFLAEYNRKIRFTQEKERALLPNTGGQTNIQVYYYEAKNGKGPYVQLIDRYGKYHFDLKQVDKKVLSVPDGQTGEFVGSINGLKGSLIFVKNDSNSIEQP